jgi:hypothetical protein
MWEAPQVPNQPSRDFLQKDFCPFLGPAQRDTLYQTFRRIA